MSSFSLNLVIISDGQKIYLKILIFCLFLSSQLGLGLAALPRYFRKTIAQSDKGRAALGFAVTARDMFRFEEEKKEKK